MPTHGGIPSMLKKFDIPARKGKFQVGNKANTRSGKDSVGWKGGKKTVKCDFCGEELKKYPSLIKNLNFCNMECKGNYKRKDMLGKKVGLLTVIKQEGKDKHGKHLWVCECECGETKSYTASDLSIVKSCGCLNYQKGENNPMYKEKVDFTCPICGETKKVRPSYPTWHSTCSKKECRSQNLSENHSGKKNVNWIGGSECYGYETAKREISFAEKVRRDPENKKAVQVKCTLCKKWFTPTQLQVTTRRSGLLGKVQSEGRFYCSDECKGNCSIFKKQKYPKGFHPTDERQEIVDPEIRNLVLDRDDHQCQKCGETEDLCVHHIEGVMQSPITANDIDNCITLCTLCHAEIHSQPGCTYYDYQRDSCETIKEAVNL